MKPFENKCIGVLMGGISGEREVSLRSGNGVLESLRKQGYKAVGIDVNSDVAERLKREGVEVAFLALHGLGGEDGRIQGLLEWMCIPYTGSGVLASAVSMDKIITKCVLEMQGIPTPKGVVFNPAASPEIEARRVLDTIGLPAILKPSAEGSSLGVEIIHEAAALAPAVAKLLAVYPRSFAEQYIVGRDVTVGVVGFGEAVRAVPVLELRPKNEFYDFEAKYTAGMTEFLCPAPLSPEDTAEVQELALRTHHALGCRGVSRTDVVIARDGKKFVLELNSIPGMTTLSDLPAEVKAEGGDYDSLVLEILASATLNS